MELRATGGVMLRNKGADGHNSSWAAAGAAFDKEAVNDHADEAAKNPCGAAKHGR
jgi:hypothetical protein